MELLVGFALAIVIYCSYLTLRDAVGDLQREGILQSLARWRKQAVGRICSTHSLYGPGTFKDDNFPSFPSRSAVTVRIRNGAVERRIGHARLYHD